MAHPFLTEHNQLIERTVQGTVIGLKRSEFLLKARENGLPRSFLGLMQMYPYETATSLKCNALVAYPVHVMWLNFTAKRRGYSVDQGSPFLFFSTRSAEVDTKT